MDAVAGGLSIDKMIQLVVIIWIVNRQNYVNGYGFVGLNIEKNIYNMCIIGTQPNTQQIEQIEHMEKTKHSLISNYN